MASFVALRYLPLEAGGTKHLMGCVETGEPLFFEW
jgi:hypothetical protein